ncbi:meiotic sister-chromatid recombination aldehyde dehydrogenase [Laetiporus sulphureus 93-53]|uniref:Meiotic sister-chromatid recombination aldehyde dehydrogenase n=1 Tax=Laetiporus sulphureus 93-53 TaxID=1314785 RepID=A0A165FAL6_9APHY|nr:meiotic sister-chromatid recombination aldehyde dehydrogenase [Laetiporus sulphureus 93-53]KZT08679.1 meiotic sister-chromatid recombination aldehyde dehydrogenase [Laetiporus sulphureus 93-53]
MADYDYDDEEGVDVFYMILGFVTVGVWLVIHRYRSILNRAVPFHQPAPPEIGPRFEAHRIPNPSLESHLVHEDLRPAFTLPGRKYITSYDPATSYHLATILADSHEEISQKIGRAVEAQRVWKRTDFRDRRRVMKSLKKWLVDNQEVCAKVACRDTGKTMLDAALGEVLTTCSKLDWLINHGERYLRPDSRHNNFLMFYKSSYVFYEPLGVVAAIVSWNYPLHNAWSPIIAALFAGNAVVLKCSEQVIWSSRWFVGTIQECLRACGHDPGLVQLVCCYPEEAEALIKSELIKHITFIGSETVGRKVAMAATVHLTPVTLELGGKDPAVILPHTNLEQYISLWMRGVYQNAGQNCIGIERLIVHSSQHDRLHEMMWERVDKLRLGTALANPNDGFSPEVDMGAMISGQRAEDTAGVVQLAFDAGLDVKGGEQHLHPLWENGSYFLPTVIANADPESELAQRELFAPVALLIKYETIEEAIAIANGTRYGLGASVFGPDQEKCLKVAKELECGMVAINDFGVFYLNQDLPFGGFKASGYGRFGGPEGLRALTNPKAIVVDRFAWLVQTSIPRVVDYPIPSVRASWDFISGLVGFVYGDGWRLRIDSLKRLIQAVRR